LLLPGTVAVSYQPQSSRDSLRWANRFLPTARATRGTARRS